MRLLIIGAFTPANLGDGAIVSQMIVEAKRVFGEDCDILVSATDPEAFRDLLGIDAHGRLLEWSPLGTWRARIGWLTRTATTALSLWIAARRGRSALERLASSSQLPAGTQRALAEMLSSDLVLSVGGGYLADPYRKQFPFWYLEHLCVHAAGAPLVFFSQSLGPANKWLSRYFLPKSLALSSAFITRDQSSADWLRRLGTAPGTDAVCADVALTAPRVAAASHDYRTLGVSLLKWVNFAGEQAASHNAYLDAVEAALIERLTADSDLRVRLYATNRALGRNVMDDVAVCREMLDRIRCAGHGDRCSVAPWTADTATYCSDVSACDLLIASRMHSAVLALSQDVAVVGIAYEEKMCGLLTLFGLGDHCVSIEEPEAIGDTISRAWTARESIRATVHARLPELQLNASSAMDLCSRVFEQSIGARPA